MKSGEKGKMRLTQNFQDSRVKFVYWGKKFQHPEGMKRE